MVLDEPTGGLDENSRKEVMNMLESLKNSQTIIICITHDKLLLESKQAKLVNVRDGNLYEYRK